MLLRDDPLLSYKRNRSWPPTWTRVDGQENTRPRGEVGILKEVLLSNISPCDRCFLYIEYKGSTYIGCLLIEDEAFCSQIAELLKRHYNRPMAEIGSLDLSHTL
jgi:hypothetical protein